MKNVIQLLIIDDCPEDRELYRRLLRNSPDSICTVTEAESAEEGFGYLLSRQVDCLLLDFNLPDLDGLECLSALAKDGALPVPVVMLTGAGSESVAVEAMRRGAQDYLVKDRVDADSLQRAITHATERHQILCELEEARASQRYLATHDSLTGLYNRHEFCEQLTEALSLAKRDSRLLGVCFVDLKDFKSVNNTLGHPIGDVFLNATAQRLRSCIGESDVAARFGGDEFALLLKDLPTESDIGPVAERIFRALASPDALYGHRIPIAASIGGAVFPRDGESAEELLAHADRAMYSAKLEGPNTFRCYDRGLQARYLRDRAIERRLAIAVEEESLHLEYQPQVSADDNFVIGAEALVRWHDQELGMVYPDEFIRVAEQSCLIEPLGERVLRAACEQHHQWRLAGWGELRMAVNLSVRQLTQENLVALVEEVLAKDHMSPHQLDLEVTESAVMKDVERSIQTLHALKDLGVRISIDDFGTGHSSLGYLKRLPADGLKIDRSFIEDVTTDSHNRSITEAIIAMARALDLETIAEGVETHEQMDYLCSQGCHRMQGYLFSKPVLPDEFPALLADACIAHQGAIA